MRKISYLIVIILIFFLVIPIKANSAYVVKEILVLGLSRSQESLVLKQLPFKEGDVYQKQLLDLAKKRLLAANIFDSMNLNIISEPLANDELRVVIRVSDTSILYMDPLEFIIMNSLNLMARQYRQRFRNPLGNGINLTTTINWSNNPALKLELEAILNQGKIITGDYSNFKRIRSFNDIVYKEETWQTAFSLRQIPRLDWEMKNTVQFSNSNYLEKDKNEISQSYLLLATSILNKTYTQIRTDFTYAYSLNEQPNFYQLSAKITEDIKFNDHNALLFIFRGGLAAAQTPLNYQFKAGGFSLLPFRGQSFSKAGNRYLSATAEFHRQLFLPIINKLIFIDTGKIVATEDSFAETPLFLNAGIGLAIDTPLEFPVRADFAFNLKGSGFLWNIGLGHSF